LKGNAYAKKKSPGKGVKGGINEIPVVETATTKGGKNMAGGGAGTKEGNPPVGLTNAKTTSSYRIMTEPRTRRNRGPSGLNTKKSAGLAKRDKYKTVFKGLEKAGRGGPKSRIVDKKKTTCFITPSDSSRERSKKQGDEEVLEGATRLEEPDKKPDGQL